MQESQKISDIQILRAVAILLVLAHHIKGGLFSVSDPIFSEPLIQRFYIYFAGEVGVDLFFVISGYVIARGLLPELEASRANGQQSVTLIRFWTKRAFRLLPSAWFWLGATLFFTIALNSSGAFGSFRSAFEGSIAAVLNVANIRFMECYGYFECGPTPVYWSLSLEEQFYLAFPIMAVLLRRYLLSALLFLATTQLFETLSAPTGFRFTGLIIGVLIAIFSKHAAYELIAPKSENSRKPYQLAFMSVWLITLVTVLSDQLHIVSGTLKYDLAAAISGIFVLIASYNRDVFVPSGTARLILLWIGSRSYTLYLAHMPAYYLTRELLFVFDIKFQNPWIQLATCLLGATILLLSMTELSFRFVERYWQQRGAQLLLKLSPAIKPAYQEN